MLLVAVLAWAFSTPAPVSISPFPSARFHQPEYFIEFTVGQQPRVAGDLAADELQHQADGLDRFGRFPFCFVLLFLPFTKRGSVLRFWLVFPW